MLKRLWRFIRKPSRIAWSVIFVAGIGAGIIGWGGFHAAMKATNNMEYCVSCHEMETPFEEYKETAHFRNPSGVQANCTDCHVPHEPWSAYVMTKVIATKDLYHHYMGTIDTPEKYEARRLHMARLVWDRMEENDSRTCRSCHAFDAMIIKDQAERAREEHTKAMEDGTTCIACHKGVAHTLPDMRQAFAEAFKDLKEESADAVLDDDAYTLTTMPFFMEKDGERAAGKLLPATRLEVLDKDGDWLHARVSGWRQEGAESVMYGAKGQRILTAAMSKPVAEAVSQGEAEVVETTGQTWFPVSLDIWVPQENLTGSIKPVWDYAGSLYKADCAVCHVAHHRDQFPANQWIGQLKSMERFTQLNKEQNRLVLKYLQYHAKDAPDAPDMM